MQVLFWCNMLSDNLWRNALEHQLPSPLPMLDWDVSCINLIDRGGGGGVTKYFDVSSEEKTLNDHDCDTDCRYGKNAAHERQKC